MIDVKKCKAFKKYNMIYNYSQSRETLCRIYKIAINSIHSIQYLIHYRDLFSNFFIIYINIFSVKLVCESIQLNLLINQSRSVDVRV